MDLFNQVLRWHPRFMPLQVAEDKLLLLSEGEPLVLGSAAAVELARMMARGHSLAEHVQAGAPSGHVAWSLHLLEVLTRQGHVLPASDVADAGMGEARYALPEPAAPYERLQTPEGPEVITLSQGVGAAQAVRWAQAMAGAGAKGLTLVLCDDLLDARLDAIHRAQRATGKPWLLCRPTGLTAWLGPLFKPQAGWACWRCLADRVLRNQPVRAWWQDTHGAWPGVPVRCDAAWVAQRLSAAQALWPALSQAHTACMVPIDERGEAAVPHEVHARPQCPACGRPGLQAERQQAPLAWASDVDATPCRPDAQTINEHARSMSAQDTVARLRQFVSPLCGVVSHIDAVPVPQSQAQSQMVYSSGFFKTPKPGETPLTSPILQLCMGRGASAVQAQASALCEAIERYAAFYQGDEAWVSAQLVQASGHGIAPSRLAMAASPEGETPMRWAPAWSLTRQARAYLPLGFCYAHAPADDVRHIGWTSNGCAAGNTLEEAMVHGFLELVERDAAAVWWYNRLPRPAVSRHHLTAASMPITEPALPEGWRHWLLDITHDVGIPVVVGIAHHERAGQWALGFGCGFDMSRACNRALTEVVQLIAAGKHVPVPQPEAGDAVPRFLLPSPDALPARQLPTPHVTNMAGLVKACVQAAADQGLETLVLDYTRPDLPLHTVKVVVPGLCHIWPEYFTARLDEVPLKMAWAGAGPQGRNPVALYV
jgi:ribosomal protein S12 methylthiotransferase accessory factor